VRGKIKADLNFDEATIALALAASSAKQLPEPGRMSESERFPIAF
jgi:hypothetical protein